MPLSLSLSAYRIKTEFVDPICSCVELARKCDYMTFLKKVT